MLEKIVGEASRIGERVNKFYNSKANEMFNEGGFADSILTVLGVGLSATLVYSYLKGSFGFIKDFASQISRFY